MKRLILVKPPEPEASFYFGLFSLSVLAGAVRDLAEVRLFDATELAPKEAARCLWEQKPSMVGVTLQSVTSIPEVEGFLQILSAEARTREVPIIVGGHGATAFPERLLSAGATAVVLGEGEETLTEILSDGLTPGMAGVLCLDGEGELLRGPSRPLIHPLGRLPMPARDLMATPPEGIHLVETSRGCPHRCTFCETTRFHGRRWRGHQPSRVVAEIVEIVEKHDAWTIMLADDNAGANPKRLLEICRRLKGGPLPAIIMASLRADDLLTLPELIPALAEARILRVALGVETLEPAASTAAGKTIDKETYREVFARLRAEGIFTMASLIVGLPGELVDDDQTLEELADLGPDAAVFLPLLPIPGTPLAKGRDPFSSDPEHIRRASALNAAYYHRAEVRRRLSRADDRGGIRGIMARSILMKRPSIG